MLRALAVAIAIAVVASAGASAASPAAGLAKQLGSSMQAFYKTRVPGLKITTVSCKIASSGSSAACKAHFTIVKAQEIGVFGVNVTEKSTGAAQTKTVSVACHDSKTGKPVKCFGVG
ncbi:MAG TPA: hypothetical protein VG265_10155 [Gaiellaceae bacterium]|nr:hypothetical protein [Gaiellaceae bacterium]